MMYTSVMPCLSTGLAKNSKIMSMFVLFSRLFWPLWKFGFFFQKWGTKAVEQDVFGQFFKLCIN